MIEAHALIKRYRDVVAVDGVDFRVKPGRVTGFLGPNGAGKSTTMRMILGLDLPSSGAVTVNGRRYDRLMWPLHEVGALIDAKAVHPGRTAFRHLLALAVANGIARRRVDEVIEMAGLEPVAGKRAGGFSLGMCQRLGIAAALLGDPGILLFDEPVNGLDPDGIVWIRTLMRSLAAQGRTVLVSSHLMSEMALTADHLLVIGQGRLLADAPLSEFITANSAGEVRVRVDNPAALVGELSGRGAAVTREADGTLRVANLSARSIGEIAARAGLVVYQLADVHASLEEAYFRMTAGAVSYRSAVPAGQEAAA